MSDSQSPGAVGHGVNATWNYTLGSMVFFIVMINLISVTEFAVGWVNHQRVIDLVLLLLVMVAAAVQIRYCWFLRVGVGGGLPHLGWTIALFAPAIAAWLLATAVPGQALMAVLPLWLAFSLVVCLVPKSKRWPLLGFGAVVAFVPIAIPYIVGNASMEFAQNFRLWMVILYGASLPFMLLASLWWWRVVLRLDESRKVAAELAVTQERLRFAADLHDIQGHHLQVIALKSELAERMLERDPAKAAEQVHEIRLIAKEAMEETRSLVAGLREVALADELENAREVLTLAGAECTLDLGPLPEEPGVHRALALAVREATTNILRHSDASEASITLRCDRTGCELLVTNNGCVPGQDQVAGRATGSGLAGLRGRVEVLGGTLDAGLTPNSERFEVRVWAPVRTGIQV